MFDHPALMVVLFAQQTNRLPALLRAKAIAALLGLVVLGLGMVLMILLGGWAVKRRIRQRSGPSQPPDDTWYRKPLEPPSPDSAAPDSHDD
ncbi:MAG TPA: hypothetical protein VHC22_26660 [Pirellulales bacterium]|nr:hypothetical protein [Pirellulales bacterium]